MNVNGNTATAAGRLASRRTGAPIAVEQAVEQIEDRRATSLAAGIAARRAGGLASFLAGRFAAGTAAAADLAFQQGEQRTTAARVAAARLAGGLTGLLASGLAGRFAARLAADRLVLQNRQQRLTADGLAASGLGRTALGLGTGRLTCIAAAVAAALAGEQPLEAGE